MTMITATACRILPRRCRLSSTSAHSIRSSSSLPFLSSLETKQWAAPAAQRRNLPRPRRCSFDHETLHRQRQDARWLSSTAHSDPSSSSTSDDNDDDDRSPSIEVTVTNSSSSESDVPDPSDDTNQELSSDGTSSTGPNLAKSPDQITEEEILSLQSELRSHHRHAAYSDALTTATRLLEMTLAHFGNSHPATASAHNNVGLMNKLLGNYEEAKEAYHEALRVYGEVCGKDHASYAAALSNLGMLERGRVLESEAAEGDGEDDDDGDSALNEDDIDLAELRDSNKPQTSKTKMSALDRMQLNESAIEYFDEAYRIRLSELGSNHPHTITSRSQLGSAMAAAVIAERKGRIGGLVESELRELKRAKNVKDVEEMEGYVPEAIARAAAKSGMKGSQLTKRRWEAAEEHLRGALATAVQEPRGESVGPLTFIPVGGSDNSSTGTKNNDRQGGLTLPLKKDRSLSKKDRKRMEKERKREKRQANANALQSKSGEGNAADSNTSGGKIAVQGVAGKVTTLSAATAAQNLAVFLKNYADWMRLTLSSDDEADTTQQKQQQSVSELNRTIQEARHLYEAALHVRSLILLPHHPEVVATKFSLAELLDSPAATHQTMQTLTSSSTTVEESERVDARRANALREEILNAYNVEERDDDGSSGNVAR